MAEIDRTINKMTMVLQEEEEEEEEEAMLSETREGGRARETEMECRRCRGCD